MNILWDLFRTFAQIDQPVHGGGDGVLIRTLRGDAAEGEQYIHRRAHRVGSADRRGHRTVKRGNDRSPGRWAFSPIPTTG